jgi:hypothetical protein
MSDITTRMVYETEGQHGGDVRGWHGQAAYEQAMEREREEYMRERQRQESANE